MGNPDSRELGLLKLLQTHAANTLKKYQGRTTWTTREAVNYLHTALDLLETNAHIEYRKAGSPPNATSEFNPFTQSELAFYRASQQNSYWLNYSIEDNYDNWTNYGKDKSEFKQVLEITKLLKMNLRVAKLLAYDAKFPQISTARDRSHESDEAFDHYRSLIEEIQSMPSESYEEAEEILLAYHHSHKEDFRCHLPRD